MIKHSITKIMILALSGLAVVTGLRAGPPSLADVGDVDSFGKNAVFMGAESGFITLQTVPCDPTPTPTPSTNPADGNQCFQITDTSVTFPFDAENICRINLPGDSAKSIIYPVLNFFYSYRMNNTTTGSAQARFQFTANITIVSDVLNDPSCFDPNAGDPAPPCGGKLTFQFAPNRVFDDRHLDAGEHAEMRMTLTRAGNAGISKANLIGEGLPPALVDKLFHKPMTLQLNVVGTAKNVDFSSITPNMRLFGDH